MQNKKDLSLYMVTEKWRHDWAGLPETDQSQASFSTTYTHPHKLSVKIFHFLKLWNDMFLYHGEFHSINAHMHSVWGF